MTEATAYEPFKSGRLLLYLPSYNTSDFGDSKESADELGHLVKTGVKTATSALVWELEESGEGVPHIIKGIELLTHLVYLLVR